MDSQRLKLILVPFHDGVEGADRGHGPARVLDVAHATGCLEPLGSVATDVIC